MKLANFKKNNTLVSVFVDSDGLKNEQEINNCFYSIVKQNKAVDLVVIYNLLTEAEISTLENIVKKPILTSFKKDESGQTIIDKHSLEEGEEVNYKLVKSSVTNLPKIFNFSFNLANENGYEFFSLAEQEDTFAINWFECADTYFKEEKNVSIFLPLMRNVVNGSFAGVINEAPWVEGLADEAGVVDVNLLLRFNVINILGAVLKVSKLEEVSEKKEDGLYYPMKESIKLTHTYEFFLRMIYNDLRIKTIPRLGYELRLLNKTKFLETSSKVPQNIQFIPKELGGVSQQEIQFYFDLAKKEYFFEKDRNVVFF